MNRFFWLVRREFWEHKAIWIAPAIVIGALFLLLMIFRMHIGYDIGESLAGLPREGQIRLHQFAYAIATVIVFVVMGVVGFFYSIDALYADRADRSVLFWKSLPVSDAETVLSKFATGAVLIPLVALAGSVIAQIVIGGGVMAKLSLSGQYAGLWLHPQALAGGALVALVACVTAMLWYAPLVGYLMLVSAWAPRAPFLWAVLPPVAALVLEKVVMQTSFVGSLIASRVLGIVGLVGDHDGDHESESLANFVNRLGQMDPGRHLRDFYASPELWGGVVVAALLIAAAMWARRYRDETS